MMSWPPLAIAQEDGESAIPLTPVTVVKPDMPTPRPEVSEKSETTRNFYQVLDDVLLDFEYDLKNGNVIGMKDLAIRNIGVSENIPPSFKQHLELLITEKILQGSKTRVLQCLQCRGRKASLAGNQVVLSSLGNNAEEMNRIAQTNGIQHFMDIAFSYQPTGIVLSMYITRPDSGNVTWSKSYNSETSRATAVRRGLDYNQLDEAHKEMEYSPTIQSRMTLYYLVEPAISKNEGCLALGYRMMERYDNRKKEVGFELNYLVNAATIVNPLIATPQDLYPAYRFNLTLLFMHAWNLIGNEENFNRARGSIFIGLGGTYVSGYLGGIVRGGYEIRLGKHFSTSLNVGYRPQASAFYSGVPQGDVRGIEYGVGVSVLF